MLKKRLSIEFRKYPRGPEKIITHKIKRINPYCSIIIITSVLKLKMAKSNFEPSSGGKGIRLKKAKSTFQKIIIIRMAKNIEPNDPETAAEICSQDVDLTPIIIAAFTAVEMKIILAIIAAASAIKIFDTGPPSATIRGPHF